MAAKRSAGAPSELARYDAKRDFERTPEPRGEEPAAAGAAPIFVVQMHRASRLHYDFRLEADGVLKSWAVPKGPSLDTRAKRFAAQVEDHPYDYHGFEGIIPKGNYGAGEVIVWDRGTYRLLEGDDATAQIAKGTLKFELFGERLHGGFALVRMKGKDGEETAWLLIKERDGAVDPGWKVEEHATSVVSGKSLQDLAKDPNAPHWASRPVAPAAPATARTTPPVLPPPFEPMLAAAVERPFDDERFLFEVKWDGYRALARIEADGSCVLQSRGGIDFAPKFDEFKDLAAAFSERPLIVDGEIVMLDADGHASFGALQERLDRFGRRGDGPGATFVVFDCCFGDGRDLREEPLEARKRILERVLTGTGPVMYSQHVERDGISLFELARSRHVEGIVAKRRDSPYRSRRTRDWLKVKTVCRQEFVVGGWTESKAGSRGFAALAVGVYDGDALRFVATVGSGFDGRLFDSIGKRLEPLARTNSPFSETPKTTTRAHWTQPQLVVEVEFAEWTSGGRLRQPIFIGVRDDKDPRSVVREGFATAASAKAGEPVVPAAEEVAPAAEEVAPALQKRRGASESVTIGGRALAFTNRDKILFPDDGITKGDLIAYYRSVAPWILPHVADRPMTLERFPDGIAKPAFFEKHKPRGAPAWLRTVTVPTTHSARRTEIDFVLCNDEATLAYLANLGAIVLHVWTSHVPDLDRPEFVFFDLDPWDGCTLATLATVAAGLRDLLAEVGLATLVKTSGGTGLHVVIPLELAYGYDDAKVFAEIVARRLHARLPALTTLERTTAKRPHGTVYLDYVQVGRGKTLVSAYSARAKTGATVSMPLPWSAVDAMRASADPSADLAFSRYTVRTVPALLAADGDAWDARAWRPQRLEDAIARAATAWTAEVAAVEAVPRMTTARRRGKQPSVPEPGGT